MKNKSHLYKFILLKRLFIVLFFIGLILYNLFHNVPGGRDVACFFMAIGMSYGVYFNILIRKAERTEVSNGYILEKNDNYIIININENTYTFPSDDKWWAKIDGNTHLLKMVISIDDALKPK
jgi:hypothetical protein